MLTMYKYPIEFGEAAVPMHDGANILYVGERDGALCLWACVDTQLPLVSRTFTTLPTGRDIGDAGIYVGTVEADTLDEVWHIFEQV